MATDEAQSDYELQFGTAGEGAEGEEDLDSLNLGTLSEAVVTGADWTAETILRQLERGNIKLDPLFQRRDAWSRPSSLTFAPPSASFRIVTIGSSLNRARFMPAFPPGRH